jgi:glycosyltransferase involved in cell wall biosynthesis
MGAPVVIGPMNGNIDYPPGLRRQQPALTRLALQAARLASGGLNRLLPGKLEAAALLVANERTRLALPSGARGAVHELVENGVDLEVWRDPLCMPGPDRENQERRQDRAGETPVTFVYLGRLVDWKAVDLLIEAFARARAVAPMRLLVVGDGDERASLEQRCRELGVLAPGNAQAGQVEFVGWQPQPACAALLAQADALLLSSLMECGGAVVLEAMACAMPVVATAWGGPCDYLDPSCGRLVPPDSRAAMVEGFAAAMLELARSPELRERLGRAGRAKVERCFDWERKADRMLQVYGDAIAAAG